MSKPTIHDTFCNPIVLPNYPTLQIHRGPRTMNFGERPDTWGRKGKTIISEHQVIAEVCPEHFDNSGMSIAFGHGHLRDCEQDVRATADPSPYFFEGKWWLYPTSGMIYSSEDLVHWEYHEEPTWKPISAPMAPTVEKVGDVYVAAANNTPVFTAPTPAGPWTNIGEWTLPDGREFTCGDVMIFADDDGRAYLYFGLGITIMGAEIDVSKPNQLLTIPKLLISFQKNYWWERFGADNQDWTRGCLEGSWMIKHGSTYYLTYSCSGTQFYSYAMGAYTSDSPLGDFMPQPRNPVSYSREGFIKGGGHGGFVKGPNDTLWVFYTIPVCIDGDMERRIGMDPAGFDAEGNLFAITGIDVPQWNPGVKQHPELGNATELVPLSLFMPTLASSYAPNCRPLFAVDETMHTWWQPAADDSAPTFSVALRNRFHVSAIRIMWKDIGLDIKNGVLPGPYKFVVEAKSNNDPEAPWTILVDAAENETDLTVDYRTFEPVEAVMVRIRILGAPEGITPGLINFTVFGESVGKPNRQF